jgi:hypothetical protein
MNSVDEYFPNYPTGIMSEEELLNFVKPEKKVANTNIYREHSDRIIEKCRPYLTEVELANIELRFGEDDLSRLLFMHAVIDEVRNKGHNL